MDSGGTVSWQSTFWALVAIAVNSCLQESGHICEIEAKFGLLVKSSPAFCLVDTLIVWGQLIYYLTRVPPREALRIVARCRKQHDDDTREESTSCSSIVARCLLLVLAVLQALKLYAMGGIPWTQAFGTIYLLSYATNGVLNVLGRPKTTELASQSDMRRGDILPSRKLILVFAVVAACLQIAIWTAVVRVAIPGQWLAILEKSSCRWPVDIITYIPFYPAFLLFLILEIGAFAIDIAILFLPSAVVLMSMGALIRTCFPSLSDIVANSFSCSVQTLSYTFAILFTLPTMSVELCFVGWLPVTTAFLSYRNPFYKILDFMNDWDRYTPYGMAFLVLAIVSMIGHFLYRALFMGSLAQKLGITNYGMSSNLAWACLHMFLVNVSLALVYYGHVYSPEGTWKPSWIDILGRLLV